MSRDARAIALAVVLVLGATHAAASPQFDPAYRFRVLSTPHFLIYFHQGEDRLAARLAAIAEDTWRALVRPFGVLPPKLTHVVLVDQAELSNGYATPVPRNTVVVYAVWPAGSDFLKTDDWLRLVFTHEFTHIVHLDRSEGWARLARGVLGRAPVVFPNLFLPTWQVEGLATFEESAITGEGRLHAGDFKAIVGEAARARRPEPIDRVNGGLTSWPGGLAAYAYGAGFHAYLARRYGADTLAALAEFTARELPFTGSMAFETVYGRSLGALWRDYEDSLSAPPQEDIGTGGERLTRQGFDVGGPRFVSGRCATCPIEVWYSVQTADEFPAIYRVSTGGGAPERVTTRYLGSTIGVGSGAVYFDQQDLRANTGLYSDLYVFNRATGDVRRLTTHARIVDPDLSPDGRTIVAARNRPGARDLVLAHLDSTGGAAARRVLEVTTLAAEPDTQFNAPRWSPDGQSIAVERHRPGGEAEIVIVDATTHGVRVVTAAPKTRWVTPTWRPDGRALIAAADFDEGPFNLYEIDLTRSDVRRLTNLAGGATWPVVSPDGLTIVYVGYTIDGFDLFRMPYPTADVEQEARRPAVTAIGPELENDNRIAMPAGARSYTPWSTLRPTAWWPILETTRQHTRLGATTSGADVLGYHGYFASATWLLVQPPNTAAVTRAAPDWQVSYAYARWRPVVFGAASRETSFFAGPPADDGTPSTTVRRERLLEGGIIFPVIHVRLTQTVRVSVRRAADDYAAPAGRLLGFDRSAARLSWAVASAHLYGNSISAERGLAAGVTTELVRRAIGASADVTTMTGDARAYLPGLGAHHVLALRLAGGASTGDRSVRQSFLLGGAGPNADPAAFSSDGFSLLRGFPADSFAGSHAALANADYRWPIARIERGLGTWPVFLHTVHAAVFADAGHVWTTAFAARDVKTSIGAELSADAVLGYRLPITAAIGAAWGHDGRHMLADRATIFFRLGRAF